MPIFPPEDRQGYRIQFVAFPELRVIRCVRWRLDTGEYSDCFDYTDSMQPSVEALEPSQQQNWKDCCMRVGRSF